MGYPTFGWGYSDRRLMGDEPPAERRPIILKECAKCHDLVDRETLFAGVCCKCPPPKITKEITHDQG